MNMTKGDRLKGRKTLKVANFLDEFEKDDIKKDVDIVSLFNHFGVKLTQKGKSFVGRCPWHEDKTPSLSVDRGKGLYNCFGCGESGDIFTLVEKMKGFDFKESVSFLKTFSGKNRPSNLAAPPLSSSKDSKDRGGAEPLKARAKEDSKDKEEPPLVLSEVEVPAGTSAVQNMNLTAVAEYYHKKLFDNPKALEYLKSRGFEDRSIFSRFKIGFADGTLLEKLSEGHKKSLEEQGIITEKESSKGVKTSREHFSNCITFPIFDDTSAGLSAGTDKAVGMYGRSINPKAKIPHLYLKGKHKGIFNRKASKVYAEIILTESIIDALSLIALGIENVQPVYGTNGFTDEHLSILKDDRVKVIVIAFDSDEAGKTATEKLKEQLISEGFAVKVVTSIGAKDWNEYLVSGGTKEAVKETIEKTVLRQAQEPENGQSLSLKAEKDHLGYLFTISDIIYRVIGVKEMFVTSLRVNIKAVLQQAQEPGDECKYFDNLDLYSARSRSSYSSNLGKHFDLEPKRIEKDLVTILEYLERERDRHLTSGAEKQTAIEEMSEEEKELGKSFLMKSNIYSLIIDDMTTLGYVGEDENKLLVWLAAVSRLLPKPLSIFIQSPPSTGKSFLLETLLRLLPEESAEWITSMSDQAFNYMDEDDFLDNVFMMGEALHNDVIEGYIRQMQSENKISRKVTIKDPQSGMMKTSTVKHDVRLVFMQTSTAMKVNIENLSRCLVLKVDASREQTERVQAMQRYKESYEGHLEERHVIPDIIKKHLSAQRLLKKIKVFNPFEKYIRFPSTRSIMRRGQTQFLGLLQASCVARQFQKEPVEKINTFTGEVEHVYECDLTDYEMVRSLFINGKLLQQDENLSSSVIGLYEDIRKMVSEKAKKEDIEPEDLSFIQTEVREITNLGHESVKRYIRILVEYEYILVVSGRRHGTRLSYRLRENSPIHQVDIASIIPTVEEIKNKIGKINKKPGKSG